VITSKLSSDRFPVIILMVSFVYAGLSKKETGNGKANKK